jgi:transcriptional regulator with XRE-family HTH domain
MNTLLGFPATDGFGRLLRHWRTSRRMSQLALATEAGISTRHLSFLETGRAQPSREMVQLLAGMLDVPAGDRNALLLSAGYAPVPGERPLGPPELEPVRRALQFILRQQEPFPAFVLDAHWNIVMRNDASRRIFGLFKGAGEHDMPGSTKVNVMRTVFDPGCLRRFIVNWENVAGCLMQSMHRDIAATGSDDVIRMRDEMLSYPGVPSRWAAPDSRAPEPSLIAMQLRKDDLSMAFFPTVTTFAAPRDVTLQQLKIECFFPADAVTEQVARRLALPEPVAV